MLAHVTDLLLASECLQRAIDIPHIAGVVDLGKYTLWNGASYTLIVLINLHGLGLRHFVEVQRVALLTAAALFAFRLHIFCRYTRRHKRLITLYMQLLSTSYHINSYMDKCCSTIKGLVLIFSRVLMGDTNFSVASGA